MGISHSQKSLRFHIETKTISGSFVVTFEPYITNLIENEIDSFIECRTKKIQKENLSISKNNNYYILNVRAFIYVCNIIFRVLKENS